MQTFPNYIQTEEMFTVSHENYLKKILPVVKLADQPAEHRADGKFTGG